MTGVESYRSHFKLAFPLNTKQNRLTMKTRSLVLTGAVVLVLAACATGVCAAVA